MIYDNISNFKRYSSLFPEIFEYIQKVDYNQLSLGKHIISEQAFLLVNEYQSNLPEKNIFENHHNHIDIQLVTRGVEKINYTNIQNLTLTKSYDKENDYELFEGTGLIDSIVMKENNFSVFFPGEAHQPGLAVNDKPVLVKKFVFKVKI